MLRCFLVKDCDPTDGPPCSRLEHTDSSVSIYDTVDACCGRLNWLDAGACVASSQEGRTDMFFADYASGACLRDCEQGPVGCALVPPPVALYESVDACCSVGQSWVDYQYCTSRSVGNYSDGWIVDYTDERCGESRNT